MALTQSYEVPDDDLTHALGARTRDYVQPDITMLRNTVRATLESLIARRATDSENGAVVDPIIEAWYQGALASLDTQHSKNAQAATNLVARASALEERARRLSAAADEIVVRARREHVEAISELELLQTDASHRV